ncbi:MAG: hotdog fold thioesterase [Myxococcota bacterium]|nr:hotdog fold thioesterase [Myxococcota bacterium]
MRAIQEWVERSPYSAALGVRCEALSEQSVSLVLPYAEQNANPGKALHGGCAASLGVIASQAITRAALGAEAGPFYTAGLQVNYLAAAIGEDVRATGRLLRRGRNMCFAEVEVATLEGKQIAQVTTMVRGRFAAEAPELRASRGDDGATDPGPMGPHIGKLNFGRARGLEIEHMADSHARITMPFTEANADAEGGMHEGAVLALLDTTGAMAAWAETGPGSYKASTPALQAQLLTSPPKQDLVAYGRVIQRDGDGFWSDVEVAGQADGCVIARGTVLYRIVT